MNKRKKEYFIYEVIYFVKVENSNIRQSYISITLASLYKVSTNHTYRLHLSVNDFVKISYFNIFNKDMS